MQVASSFYKNLINKTLGASSGHFGPVIMVFWQEREAAQAACSSCSQDHLVFEPAEIRSLSRKQHFLSEVEAD